MKFVIVSNLSALPLTFVSCRLGWNSKSFTVAPIVLLRILKNNNKQYNKKLLRGRENYSINKMSKFS